MDKHLTKAVEASKRDRFRAIILDNIEINRDTGCWEWRGPIWPTGYGSVAKFGERHLAHRLAWELENGPIPPGLCICHHCDNPPCVNTDHLFLGTHADNMADRDAKGRGPHGPNRPSLHR